jgi:hypothetical protein
LARAEAHIQEIEHLVKPWTNGNGYKVAVESDGQGGSQIAGTLLKAPPDELGLIIGDVLEEMRSSLDNLAFALALKNKTTLTANEEEDVSFPIFGSPPPVGHRRIKHMDSAVQTKIIGLSPDPAVGPIDQNPLWLLDKTNNRDKHRVITVAVADLSQFAMTDFTGTINGPSEIGIGGPKRMSNVGDKVLFATFGPGSQIQTKLHAAGRIVFDQGIEVSDREVVPTLRWFHDYIRDAVFQTLEPHL